MFKAKKPVILLILVILLLLGLVVGRLIWVYLDLFVYPLEPETSGVISEKPEWIFQADDKVVSTPVVSDSTLFIRTCCSIYALDVKTGIQLWRINSNAPYKANKGELTLSPLIHDDYLIVPEEESIVAAYSITKGQFLWVTPEPTLLSKGMLNITGIDDYAIKDEKLFVVRYSWKLSAYDLFTGQLLWEVPVQDRATLDVEAGSKYIYISEGKILRCYEPETGNLAWEKEFDYFVGPILYNKNILYISIYLGPMTLAAMDLESMEIKWQIEPSEIPDKRLTRLTLSGDRLYATGERLYAISAQGGSIIWSSEKTGLLEHPRSFNSYLVVRTRYQDLFVIDSRSGQIIGHMLVRANGSSLYGPGRSPIIAGNLIIVPFGDNRVFAYRLK